MECRVMRMNTVSDAVQWMVGHLKTIHDAGGDSREAIEHLEATTRRRYPLSGSIVYCLDAVGLVKSAEMLEVMEDCYRHQDDDDGLLFACF